MLVPKDATPSHNLKIRLKKQKRQSALNNLWFWLYYAAKKPEIETKNPKKLKKSPGKQPARKGDIRGSK